MFVSHISDQGLKSRIYKKNKQQQHKLLQLKNNKKATQFRNGKSLKQTLLLSFLTFYFILEYSQLTMLLQFQVDSKGTQPYIYMYPFSPKSPSHPGCHITLSRVYNQSRHYSKKDTQMTTKHMKRCSPSFSSVQFSRSVVFDSLRSHESQHARPPCPSPSPGVHLDSRPLSPYHPAISSSVAPFSSCPQSLPASESFPMSQLFT